MQSSQQTINPDSLASSHIHRTCSGCCLSCRSEVGVVFVDVVGVGVGVGVAVVVVVVVVVVAVAVEADVAAVQALHAVL